jgi:hypothetical protein
MPGSASGGDRRMNRESIWLLDTLGARSFQIIERPS